MGDVLVSRAKYVHGRTVGMRDSDTLRPCGAPPLIQGEEFFATDRSPLPS